MEAKLFLQIYCGGIEGTMQDISQYPRIEQFSAGLAVKCYSAQHRSLS